MGGPTYLPFWLIGQIKENYYNEVIQDPPMFNNLTSTGIQKLKEEEGKNPPKWDHHPLKSL